MDVYTFDLVNTFDSSFRINEPRATVTSTRRRPHTDRRLLQIRKNQHGLTMIPVVDFTRDLTFLNRIYYRVCRVRRGGLFRGLSRDKSLNLDTR